MERKWLILFFIVINGGQISSQVNDDYKNDMDDQDVYDYRYDYVSMPDQYELLGNDSQLYDDYDEEADSYVESELMYIPEMLTSPTNITVNSGAQLRLPCQARDADRFVRVWLKDGEMLFTGTYSHTQDDRYSLTDDSSLVLNEVRGTDSGVFECRIMVEENLSVSHTVIVLPSIYMRTDPATGTISSPLRGNVSFGCSMMGDNSGSDITWTRESLPFRDGSYQFEGDRLEITNLSITDAGYYYCTATSGQGTTKSAAINLQVISPPSILGVDSISYPSGEGYVLEITCSVNGDPRPKITWYQNGDVLPPSGRYETDEAGSRHILIVKRFQESDSGEFMCYATNTLGSTQAIVKISHGDSLAQSNSNTNQVSDAATNVNLEEALRKLQKHYDTEKAEWEMYRDRTDQEIFQIRSILESRKGPSSVSEGLTPYDRAIMSDVDRLEQEFHVLRSSWQDAQTQLQTMQVNLNTDKQRLWDSVNELQEISNITTRNIEDIYDKDILRLQNYQNVVESDISRIKLDLSGIMGNGVGLAKTENPDGNEEISQLQLRIQSIKDEIKMLRNLMTTSRNSQQSVRNDLHAVFRDVDELKKLIQTNEINNLQLKRRVNTVVNDQVEENKIKIEEMRKTVRELENRLGKTAQKVTKVSSQTADEEKLEILISEVQRIKNQLFFLQQSIIHLRTQEHLTGGLGSTSDVAPAVSSSNSAEVAAIKTQLELVISRIDVLSDRDSVERSEFSERMSAIDSLLRRQRDEIGGCEARLSALEVQQAPDDAATVDLKHKLTKLEEILEENEREKRKVNLLMLGVRKVKELERPRLTSNIVNNFLQNGLNMQDIEIEEAYRLEDIRGGRPPPIRVKFLTVRDRNRVLTTSKSVKTKIKVVEDFTDKVKMHRQKLANYARLQSRKTRTKWALVEDRLYFNKKIFVYNETSEVVTPVEDIN